jgi:hypothetical protein
MYDRWRDAEGTPILVGARVEQIEVDRDYGALRCRQGKRGAVISCGRGCRLGVLFDGEVRVVSIRPHLVRVVAALTAQHIIAQLTQLREELPAAATGDES